MASQPLPIGPRLEAVLEGSPSGTPDLRLLRAQFANTPPPNIPPRSFVHGSPSRNSPMNLERATPRRENPLTQRTTDSPLGLQQPIDLDDLPDEEKAKVIARHLVPRKKRLGNEPDEPTASSSQSSGLARTRPSASHTPSSETTIAPQREETDPFPIPYETQGADITHDIYRWQARSTRPKPRSASVSFPPAAIDPAFEHIHEPGGFRRNYVLLRANEQGLEEPVVTSTFIDFLYIFGHFAGEDLEDEDEDDDEEEEEHLIPDEEALLPPPTTLDSSIAARPSILRQPTVLHAADADPTKVVTVDENAPLLPGTFSRSQSKVRQRSLSRSRRRRRSSFSQAPHGDATVPQAILMLLKSFIGTGVLFLGKAFFNGGMLFSIVTLTLIALISLYSFLLLVETKFVVSGSFGDIGGALYGPWMRYAILASITLSQLGFVSAYTIFVAENLQAFVMAVTKCETLVPIQFLIFGQMVVLLPLAMIRNLAKLSTTALVADAFILVGLVYIASNEFAVIAENGVAEIKMWNERNFPLLIGTAVFSFEGIGLVIPITDSMREPRRFPAVLTGVMFFLLLLFGGAGVLSYAAYGPDVQTVVITNLPQDRKMVQVVQFLYSLAILLSTPLQLFPALRIMEHRLFRLRSGKESLEVKWEKNFFRTLVVILCYFVSWAGAKDLDKFVSFIGSFACVPLCYVYPAMLHLKACADTRRQKLIDYALMTFGLLAAAYTTIQTIQLMAAPREGGGPKFGHCVPKDDPSGPFMPPF